MTSGILSAFLVCGSPAVADPVGSIEDSGYLGLDFFSLTSIAGSGGSVFKAMYVRL